jgi:hypothetical protein
MVMNYADQFLEDKDPERRYSVLAIFLYGGAAKYHLGLKIDFHDFDVNLLFSRNKSNNHHLSTYGMPKHIGTLNNKNVEVMRNVLHYDVCEDIIEYIGNYARRRRSKRWRRITSEPVIFLYPDSEVLRSLI